MELVRSLSQQPWYKFYPGDYAGDTRRLSMLEHGAYRLLLDALYAAGGRPIAEGETYRVALAFSKPEQAAVDRVLRDHWTQTDDGWTQRRAAREMAESARKSKAARARWARRDAEPHAEPHAESDAELMQNSRARASQYQKPETRDLDPGPDLDDPVPRYAREADAGGWPAQAPPADAGAGPNRAPTQKQLGYLASMAEGLERAPPVPRTYAEASRLIDEMRPEVLRRQAQRESAASQQGRLDGLVSGRHQQAADAAEVAIERIERRGKGDARGRA